MARKLIDKKIKKRTEKKCHFCPNNDYAVLHCHRIIPGEDGGRYVDHNVIVCCANCHNRIHDGQIIIDRKYLSTKGVVLHFWENGEEYWR